MSFGFGVGDFITALKLAKQLRKDFVGAPRQFREVADEVRSLSIALEDVEVGASGQTLTAAQLADAEAAARGCRSVLDDLVKTLDRYRELDPAHHGGRADRASKVWKRLTWSPDDVGELRARVASSVATLNAFHARLARDHAAEIRGNTARLVRLDEHRAFGAARKWLSPADAGAQQSDALARRQPGTGRWLLDAPEFHSWIATPGATLFCPGIPGAGKTILASVAIDHLCSTLGRDRDDVAIAFVYFDFRREGEQNLQQVLSSLVGQLAAGNSAGREAVKALQDSHAKRETRPSMDEILKVLYSVTDVKQSSRAVILIDAIDECQTSANCRFKLIDELFKLQKANAVNIFATSRFIPDIVTAFESRDLTVLEIRATDQDVRKYLDDRIDSLPSCVQRSPKLQEDIKTAIASAADGMFLLAQIYMSSLDDKLTVKSVRTALRSFQDRSCTSGTTENEKIEILSRAYDEAMARIRGQKHGFRDLAERALMWIVCAARPLEPERLQAALAFEEDGGELDDENVPELDDIISACAGLVTVDEASDTVRLAHYTTQEYFERSSPQWFSDSHLAVAKICVAFLHSANFAGAVENGWESMRAQGPGDLVWKLTGYVRQFWSHHFRFVPGSMQKENWVIGLLESKPTMRVLAAHLDFLGVFDEGRDDTEPVTALHVAAHYGLDVAIEALVQRGHDTEARDDNGLTPIFNALDERRCSTVRALIGQGAKIDIEVPAKEDPLIVRAARWGMIDIMRLLLEVERDLGPAIDPGYTAAKNAALIVASSGMHAEAVALLLDNDVPINCQSRLGRTPLLTAAYYGHESLVRLLADRGADINTPEADGYTPLMWACSTSRDQGLVRYLLSEQKADTEACNDLGETALGIAAAEGLEGVVRLLVEEGGAKLDWNPSGPTALYEAVRCGHDSVVRFLLERGADPNIRHNKAESPAEAARRKGRKDIIELFET